MAGDIGRDQVDVGQQELLEARVLLPNQVVPREHLVEVGVEVPSAVAEQTLVHEDGRDIRGERVGVDRHA